MSHNEIKQQKNITVLIANGATESGVIEKTGMVLVGIKLPAAFTGTTITFQNSVDGGTTFQQVITDAGSAYTVTVAADKYVLLDPAKTRGLQFFKLIVSAQAAARSLVAVFETVT